MSFDVSYAHYTASAIAELHALQGEFESVKHETPNLVITKDGVRYERRRSIWSKDGEAVFTHEVMTELGGLYFAATEEEGDEIPF